MSEADPDSLLMQRIGCGDPAAIRSLIGAKLPRILGLATRLLRDRSEAEDVAQEAFLRVWRHARGWRPGQARFDTWLHVVVLNLCRDRLRSRRDLPDGAAMPDEAAPDAEASLLEAERGRAVAQAIARLPGRQREAILLVHYQDLSGQEAAAALGTTVEALESLLARARRTLQAHLVTQDNDADA